MPMAGKFYVSILNFVYIITCIGYSSKTEAYNAIYDLDEMCEKQPYHVNISPSHPATFKLNATYSNTSTSSISTKRDSRNCYFTCIFSVKPKQYGSNTTLDIEWRNLGSESHDFVRVMKSDDTLTVNLENSGRRVLTITGTITLNILVTVCKMPSADHFLQITATASSPKPDNPADISSIVLAFMAPFAFILLAVVLAVMGSCCCGRRCNQNPSPSTADLGTSCPPSETGLTSSLSQPSGSRDTLFTVTSVVDKPPSYDDLFPGGFIYDETALNKLHKFNVTSSVATASERRVRSSDVSSQTVEESNEMSVVNPNEMVVVV